MGYLNNKVVTVDAILTDVGRQLLAQQNGQFQITQFALADDEIDYTLYNPNNPSGSAYYGQAIENMPLLEAFPQATQTMKYKLVTLPRGTAKMPIINIGYSSIIIFLVFLETFLIIFLGIISITSCVSIMFSVIIGFTELIC